MSVRCIVGHVGNLSPWERKAFQLSVEVSGGEGGHRASEVMYLSSQVWLVFSLVLGLVWRDASFFFPVSMWS